MEDVNMKATQELLDLIKAFDEMRPSSHDDMKQVVSDTLSGYDFAVIDDKNTRAAIFRFSVNDLQYGLKIEQGEAKVIKDEASWYQKVPKELRTHYIISNTTPTHSYVLLRWLDGCESIEEIAIKGDGRQDAVRYFIDALKQDELLFESHATQDLHVSAESSFFKDKFLGKVEQAKHYPYLYDLLCAERVTINGDVYLGPHKLIEVVHSDSNLLEYLSPHMSGFIHGDLHADNILVQKGDVYLIDPNGLDFLPPEYDHGRVLWSLSGWNAITRRHEHKLVEHGDYVYELDIPIRQQYKDGQEKIEEYFREYSFKNNLLPEQAYHRAVYSSALQYMSRADHGAIRQEAVALHLTGIVQLSKLINELQEKGLKV